MHPSNSNRSFKTSRWSFFFCLFSIANVKERSTEVTLSYSVPFKASRRSFFSCLFFSFVIRPFLSYPHSPSHRPPSASLPFAHVSWLCGAQLRIHHNARQINKGNKPEGGEKNAHRPPRHSATSGERAITVRLGNLLLSIQLGWGLPVMAFMSLLVSVFDRASAWVSVSWGDPLFCLFLCLFVCG